MGRTQGTGQGGRIRHGEQQCLDKNTVSCCNNWFNCFLLLDILFCLKTGSHYITLADLELNDCVEQPDLKFTDTAASQVEDLKVVD